MVYSMSKVLIWYLWLLLPAQDTGTMEFHLTNIEFEQGGCLRMALFDNPEAFDKKEEGVAQMVFRNLSNDRTVIHWEALAFGTYALALFHDVNDNGKLDKNALGIPVEPYAFSPRTQRAARCAG